MAYSIQPVDYYFATVADEPGEAYKLLSILRELGIDLLAFTAVPVGMHHTQLALFPDDSPALVHEAKQAGLNLEGPHQAIMVQGDDELGALADIHWKLFEANVNVYASSGLADGKGTYGYIIYVRPDEFDRAVVALEL
ncbi:MAG: hypothetical protein QNJ45_11555 [Ardenticatenaceae bacterium]|nr:hypothetical protein [Ardenticatenaceae bacterium]